MKFKRALLDNIETLVVVIAIGIIATLLAWWALFAKRLILQHTALAAAHAVDLAERNAFVQRGDRQLLMIAGEGLTFGLLLVVCVLVLFVIALRMRESKRRMERLLQFTTHELKTPIAGVRALLQSMQLGSIPEEARAAFLQQGVVEMDRLEHLTETILAYQRAKSTTAPPATAVRSDLLVSEVLQHRRRSMHDEQLNARTTADAVVMAQRDGFRVVLENLLDNARKYGGGCVTLSDSVEGDRYTLRIADTGVGFAAHDADALFDPFARADNGAGVHGSGLGLYISRQLMREMHGDLLAHSDGKGKGATFVVQLPLGQLPVGGGRE